MGNSFLFTKNCNISCFRDCIIIGNNNEMRCDMAADGISYIAKSRLEAKMNDEELNSMQYRALQKLAKELLDLRAGLWNPNGFPAVGQKHSEVLTEFCANQLDFLCVVETRSIGTII